MSADYSSPSNVLDTPAPRLSEESIKRLLTTLWGIDADELRPLDSERDLNLMIDGRYVLKVSNPAEDPDVVDMENTAMSHAASAAPDLPLPALLPCRDGALVTPIEDDNGARCLARMLTVLPGEAAEGRPITVELAAEVGALAARTSLALQGMFHRAADRELDWDVRTAAGLLGAPGVLDRLGDSGRRLRSALPALQAAAARCASLPSGINHADVTLTNVLLTGSGEATRISGLIDFGDMQHTAHVCDLAVTLTSVLRNTAAESPADTWALSAAVLNGYQRHRQLTRDEAEVLPDLVLARLGLTLAISQRRAVEHTDNLDYINQYDAATVRVLAELTDLDPGELHRRLHRLAGTGRAWLGQPAPEPAELLRRRQAVTGGTLSPVFYSQPLNIARGEGPWLFTAEGTRYLDAYNNVAVVGHAHPVVVQSVSRQLRLLNTHSRYLHGDLVELGERLLATMPAELDTILFTTSGTEANELAWRMATAVTGGNAAIIAEHAYHGSSKWLADLSPNEWPPGHRPEHIERYAAPRPSTGGVDRATAIQRVTDAGARLGAAGDRAALVLADLGFTSEGILDAPAEFIGGLVAGAHECGALFLADEVQSGFGRVGPAMWRFALAEVTPDFVTLGKPMGAGYPIGALVTRREIADALARDYEYFSTFAGSAAAAASGLAVLDVLESERIPQRAVEVGEYLRERLRVLAARDARLGEVRGIGLIAGVDVVGGGPEREARRTFARALLDALRDRHVLAGLTGPDGTVLKIRPPLVWQETHADLLVTRLEESLATLA